MANTTREKGKRQPAKKDTGPILVEDPAAITEDLPPSDQIPVEDDSEEEEAAQQSEAAAPDPRRIPTSSSLTASELWGFIAQYPVPEDLDLYVYRLFPVIRASAPPDWNGEGKWPTYQEKLKGLVAEQTGRVPDQEWLRNVRGSGLYHLRLIDRRLKRTQNRQICEAKVEINEWDTHPPVLNDWSELVPCEANKWIIQRLLKDKIIKRTPEGGFVAHETTSQEAPAAQNGGGEARMLETALRFAEKAYANNRPVAPPAAFTGKDIVDLIGKTQAANDPQKIIAAAQGLVQIAKPAEDPMLKFVLDRLAAAEDRSSRLLEKLLTPVEKPAPPPDAMHELAMGLLKKKLEEPAPTAETIAAASKMSGAQEFWKGMAEVIAPVLAPLTDGLGKIIPIVVTAKMAQGAQPAQNAQQPRPAQQVATAQPQPQQQPAPAAAPAQPAAEAPPQPQAPNMQEQLKSLFYAILDQATPTMLDTFANADEYEGPAGEVFAATFCSMTFRNTLPPQVIELMSALQGEDLSLISGIAAHKQAKEMGLEVIIDGYRNSPYAKKTVGDNAAQEKKFRDFVMQFLAYDPKAEQEEEPEQGGFHG